jgi:hypothetical protein
VTKCNLNFSSTFRRIGSIVRRGPNSAKNYQKGLK